MPDKPENRRIPYFGDFVLFDEIGRGGMGVVYDAQQSSLDRPVALKVIHAQLATTEATLQRFRIEAEATARLDHPNIVPVHEVGQHEGQPYLAMQLIEGESMAERIAHLGQHLNEKDAAKLMVKVAQAVHHAHQRGVLHRDLKPGNILIDASDEPHLIDFGLAKCLEHDSGVTQTGAFFGTPAYASPEQAAGLNKSVTTSSDVYSLGAILYALLTGQPPFAGQSVADTIEKVRNTLPLRPRSVRPTLSPDLETICLKCLEKEPARRYTSAEELAEDLHLFLDGRPIMARSVGSIERLWMWTRRNPVHAGLWAAGSMVIILSVTAVLVWRNARTRETEARMHIRRQQLLQEVQATRLTERFPGWFTRAWERAIEAASIPTAVKSGEVKDQAATLLAGVDARRVKCFTNLGAYAVVFDREGKRLLMATEGGGARLWDRSTDTLRISTQTGSGPLAFVGSGEGAQLLYDTNRHALALVDIVSSQTIREWEIPARIDTHVVRKEMPEFSALTPDGSSGISVFTGTNGQQLLLSLDADTVRLAGTAAAPVTALTLSSDGSLVALADSTGKMSVWRVHDNQRVAERVAELPASRNEILCLALTRTVRTAALPEANANDTWLLAAGDSGGVVTLWNLRTQTISAYCHGGHYQVYALAFSPDGMTLASGGRGPVKLWDVATGRLLLDIPTGDGISGLDFSSDGRRLAVGNRTMSFPPEVSVWELEFGRGIQTLRGLSAQISKVCFSADGHKIAALSHNWEVGVWDLTAGRLLRILEVPRGEFADNAAIAFSPDGKRLAFSAASSARMWELQSGVELAMGARELPPGFVDVLGFPDDAHLLLFRVETVDKEAAPFGTSPTNHPRVCRIRNLLRPDALRPIAEIPDFNWHVYDARAPFDGRCFVVQGLRVSGHDRSVMIKCFDGLTGRERWTIPSAWKDQPGAVVADAAGRFVALQNATPQGHPSTATLVEMSTGKPLQALSFLPTGLSPEPRFYAVPDPSGQGQGLALFDDKSTSPLVTLGIDAATPDCVQFDPDGSRLAWGNTDGTVTVCDLVEIQDRLRGAGLQW